MNLSTVFAKMTMLILIMLLGYLCARIGITGPEFNKRVTPLMVTVLLPATILNSVLGAPAFQAIEIVDYILVLTVMVALQMLPAWLLPRLLREKGLVLHRPYVGRYACSMEMQGMSLSLMKLDDELKRLLDAPADSPFFKQF